MEYNLDDYHVTVKPGLFKKKTSWEKIPLQTLPEWVSKIPDDNFKHGIDAVYVQPKIIGPDGKKYLWPLLDIEDSDDGHDSIEANLWGAGTVIPVLLELGIYADLEIMLTGRGLRFCYPFLIPPEYSAAFFELLEDISKTYIDLGPMKKGFIRLFAYRGHTSQGKPTMNRHTHMLNDKDDIWHISEDDYLSLAGGHISKSQAVKWLKRIMPCQTLSNTWRDVLEEYSQRASLKKCIVKIPRPKKRNDTDALDKALSYVTELGGSFTEKQFLHGTIYLLSDIPGLSRKGKTYITESGRLKDYRAGQPAGQLNEDGAIIGLSAHDWIPGYEPGVEDLEQERNSEPYKSKEDAREEIEKAIMGDDDVLITVTPGGGKTYTTLKTKLPYCHDRKIIFAVPTRKKAKELLEEASGLAKTDNHGVRISLIRGRTGGTEEENFRDENCIKAEKCREVGAMGYRPGIIVCPKCSEHKNNSCKYERQFESLKKPGLIITTHELACYITHNVDDVIFDEDPVNSILKAGKATLGEIIKFQTGDKNVRRIVRNIQTAAEDLLAKQNKADKRYGVIYADKHPLEDEEIPNLREAARVTDEDKKALDDHFAYNMPWEHETKSQYERRLYERNVNMRALRWWFTALGWLKGWACIDVFSESKGEPFSFQYQYKRDIDVKGKIIVLDGTGHNDALSALFNRSFDQIDAQIDLPDCHTVWMRCGLGKEKAKKLSDKKIHNLLKKAKKELKPNDKKILICTHLAIEDRVKSIAQNVFADYQFDLVHFNATRGVNAYKNHDAYVSFGTYTINPLEAWKRSILLFDDAQEQGDYRQHLSDAENIQTLHRIRPVNGGKTIIAMGWRRIPGIYFEWNYDLRPGKQEQMDQAYRRVQAFYEQYGFIYKDIAWMLGIGCEREKKYVKAASENYQKAPFLTDLCLIKNIILDKGQSKTPLSRLIIQNNQYWRQLLRRLHYDFPSAPFFQTCQTTTVRWTYGMGTISKILEFLERFDDVNKFDAEKWQTLPIPLVISSTGGMIMSVMKADLPTLKLIASGSEA